MRDIDELAAYTHFSKRTCLRVVDIVERECGEIGNVLIEGDEISFEVYRGWFEDAPRFIKDGKITLKLVGKSDVRYFTLSYKIRTSGKKKRDSKRKRSYNVAGNVSKSD